VDQLRFQFCFLDDWEYLTELSLSATSLLSKDSSSPAEAKRLSGSGDQDPGTFLDVLASNAPADDNYVLRCESLPMKRPLGASLLAMGIRRPYTWKKILLMVRIFGISLPDGLKKETAPTEKRSVK